MGNAPAGRRFFHTEIKRNRFRLRVALAAFFLIALLAGQVAGRAFLSITDPDAYMELRYGVTMNGAAERATAPLGYVNQVTFALLLLAWVQYRRMQRRGDEVVLSLVQTRPLQEQRMLNTGAEMAIAAGIDMPRLLIIECPELNALVCARGDARASIALTRGLLERLSRQQLQAVVAHEIAHIRSGDARLMTMMLGLGRVFHLISAFALGPLRLIFDAALQSDGVETETRIPAQSAFWDRRATVPGVLLAIGIVPLAAMLVAAVGAIFSIVLFVGFATAILLFPWLVASWALWEGLRLHWPWLDAGARRWFAAKPPLAAVLLVVPGGLMLGPAIIVLGIVVPLLLLLVRLAVARNREFQADAVAVELTRDPAALRTALIEIDRARPESSADSLPSALSTLAIVPIRRRWAERAGLGWLVRLFSTHPPLPERIHLLRAMEGRR